MLDHSLVLLCTEVCDGNTHVHDDMPFILAGGGGGTIRTGRLLDVGYRRHGDLLVAIAQRDGRRPDVVRRCVVGAPARPPRLIHRN